MTGWAEVRSFLGGARATDNFKFAADADVACTTTSLSASAASKCH